MAACDSDTHQHILHPLAVFLWAGFQEPEQCESPHEKNRAQLFKTNDVINISKVNISNMPIFFFEKKRQKLLPFFQQKISMYLVIKW